MLSSEAAAWSGGLLRRWRGVAPDIEQPALDHHYAVMHLGGPKRIRRRGEGEFACVDLEFGALSIVPAGSSFFWSTQGPIDFAHLYLEPARLARLTAEEFGRPGRLRSLSGELGFTDPLVAAMFSSMLEEVAEPAGGGRLYMDSLLHTFTLRLLHRHTELSAAPLRPRHSLAPYRLRRVLDYVEANLADDIGLTDLAEVAASSPFHFSRAFTESVGKPPYAYVLHRRAERAKALLSETDAPIATIAARCGFGSPGQFSKTFKRITGQTPSDWRRSA